VDAAIGGEGSSGGVIYPAVHLCRDSYTAMAFLLDRMAETGEPISALAARLPRYFRRLGQVHCENRRLGQLNPLLEDRYPEAQIDRADGTKLIFPDRWVHIRPSNTEPTVRIAAEAVSEDALEELYGGVMRLFDLLEG
jgi:phosphomannomutase